MGTDLQGTDLTEKKKQNNHLITQYLLRAHQVTGTELHPQTTFYLALLLSHSPEITQGATRLQFLYLLFSLIISLKHCY